MVVEVLVAVEVGVVTSILRSTARAGDRWASPATLDEIAEAVAAPSGGANEIALLAGAWVGVR